MNSSRTRLGILFSGLLLIFAAVFFLRQQSNSQPIIPLPPAPESTEEAPIDTTLYEPSYYGIPDTIAGFEVIGVLSPENTLCWPEGLYMIHFTVPQTTVEEHLASDNGTNLFQAVQDLGFPLATISVSGPGGTIEQIVRSNEERNAGIRAMGGDCESLKRTRPIILDGTQPFLPSPTPPDNTNSLGR